MYHVYTDSWKYIYIYNVEPNHYIHIINKITMSVVLRNDNIIDIFKMHRSRLFDEILICTDYDHKYLSGMIDSTENMCINNIINPSTSFGKTTQHHHLNEKYYCKIQNLTQLRDIIALFILDDNEIVNCNIMFTSFEITKGLQYHHEERRLPLHVIVDDEVSSQEKVRLLSVLLYSFSMDQNNVEYLGKLSQQLTRIQQVLYTSVKNGNSLHTYDIYQIFECLIDSKKQSTKLTDNIVDISPIENTSNTMVDIVRPCITTSIYVNKGGKSSHEDIVNGVVVLAMLQSLYTRWDIFSHKHNLLLQKNAVCYVYSEDIDIDKERVRKTMQLLSELSNIPPVSIIYLNKNSHV